MPGRSFLKNLRSGSYPSYISDSSAGTCTGILRLPMGGGGGEAVCGRVTGGGEDWGGWVRYHEFLHRGLDQEKRSMGADEVIMLMRAKAKADMKCACESKGKYRPGR